MSDVLDKPLPEDTEIAAAHPLKTGRHDLYMEAVRMVGAKHSKYALVDMVNWLLAKVTDAEERAQRAEQRLHDFRMIREDAELEVAELKATIIALTPLADEGRKAVKREIDSIRTIFRTPADWEELDRLYALLGEEPPCAW